MPELRTGIIYTIDGTITHMVNGKIHRDDGPAVEFRNVNKHYYRNGKFHREGGPARQTIAHWEWEWWIDGKMICKGNDEEFRRLVSLRAVW